MRRAELRPMFVDDAFDETLEMSAHRSGTLLHAWVLREQQRIEVPVSLLLVVSPLDLCVSTPRSPLSSQIIPAILSLKGTGCKPH